MKFLGGADQFPDGLLQPPGQSQSRTMTPPDVTPAKAGVQKPVVLSAVMDSRFRGNDGVFEHVRTLRPPWLTPLRHSRTRFRGRRLQRESSGLAGGPTWIPALASLGRNDEFFCRGDGLCVKEKMC